MFSGESVGHRLAVDSHHVAFLPVVNGEGLRPSSSRATPDDDGVSRLYLDDEQNLIILTYATADGRQEFRKERALTSFSGDHRDTAVSLAVPARNLGDVDDPDTRDRYATEATRMAEAYDADDTL